MPSCAASSAAPATPTKSCASPATSSALRCLRRSALPERHDSRYGGVVPDQRIVRLLPDEGHEVLLGVLVHEKIQLDALPVTRARDAIARDGPPVARIPPARRCADDPR